ncbi:hypothetical protein ACP70R_035268 [Stipagrostis hirtigluma subsp. patula]
MKAVTQNQPFVQVVVTATVQMGTGSAATFVIVGFIINA